MRIFTCTPVNFGGGPDFFARDSGLICRGLQSLGLESRAVMPGSPQPEDESDLIRTDYENLESADWWRSQQLDGVVLYAWGRPKFRMVAAAIREAGVFLILNQDNGGLVSPLAGFTLWLKEQRILAGGTHTFASWMRFIKLTLRGLSVGLLLTDLLRAKHLKQGNVIACVSPIAAEHYRKLCNVYGGKNLADRVDVVPHAVETRFRYSGAAKLRQVACVGRWDDAIQKRPRLLMEVIDQLITTDDIVTVAIIGSVTPELKQWHQSLSDAFRDRVRLLGRIDRGELAIILSESQLFYSPSAFESFGIAAAEALCSGCSVVAGRSVSMAAFDWFVSEDSGRLADSDSAAGHVRALIEEFHAWNEDMRDPEGISRTWCERLHTDKVATRVVELMRGR